MFPKGTKRKFSDSGEEPALPDGEQEAAAAVEAAAAAAAAATAASSSPPRTLSSSYSLQRQSLLDMSLIKLQLCHMLVEPNLCRSVLIANTVRQIQEEMTQDGTWQIMTQALAAAQCPPDRLVASEVLCRQSESGPPGGQKPLSVDEGYHSEEVVMEAEVEQQQQQISSSSYLSGPFGVSPCWDEEDEDEEEDDDEEEEDEEESEECMTEEEDEEEVAGARAGLNTDSRTGGEQVFGTFEIKQQPVAPAPPPPDPALEELFSEVDPSYYDLDTVLTGMQAAPKMGPYDLLESLSSHTPAALSSGSSCRSDLNELDHIMEIIVGS